ncbi:hypothetical protein ACFORO_36210 [Amycolatopsis halotolerans]|uniref:Double-GTPase 2 domain-containing protein n=1 Tax=Amycolatopsis halotolerans TaxID=330083 RepID=A0ABV7QQR7_9PSEU
MPLVIGLVFGLCALYFAVWAAAAALMWLILPALCILVPWAVVAGALMAAAIALLTLTGHREPPETITPDLVKAGRDGKLPKPRAAEPFGRDWAWPSYFSAQAKVDLAQVWRTNLRVLAQGWRWIRRITARGWPARIAVLLFGAPVWLAASTGALAATAAIVGTGGLVLFALWVCWSIPVVVLRTGDQLLRKVRNADAGCQACYHVNTLPAFACPVCERLHWDVRPGRLGGLWRRCGCGTRLPTAVVRAASQGTPRCRRCREPLRDGAAVVSDIRLPVFGPVSAGKTRLVYTGLLALRDGVAADGGALEFADPESRQTFDHAVALIGAGGDTTKTPTGELPHAITANLVNGRRRALLHLFDAAGEYYADREDNTALEFLDHAQGLVLVIDPFSVPRVRDQLSGGESEKLIAMASPAAEEPERVYRVTSQRLRDYGVATGKQRLAVVVVKTDLLAGSAPARDLAPGRVREWLVEAGLDNLVLSAERDFGEVRYFAVASLSGIQAGDPRSPAGPFGWLVSGAGFRLWSGSASAGLPSHEGRTSQEPVEKEQEKTG